LEDLGPPKFPAGGIPTEARRIIRQGIPFGSEVTSGEAASNKTLHGRGLLFIAYQSNINNGFQFIQHSKSPSLR
jgi:deferrochelatase/peroxidase EfeB